MGNKPSADVNTAQVAHTPTPWRVAPSGGISGNGEIVVCNDIPTLIECEEKPITDGFGRASANAEFIVRAVNSHAELVEALRALLSEWNNRTALIESCDLTENEDRAVAMAEAALKKAEVQS